MIRLVRDIVAITPIYNPKMTISGLHIPPGSEGRCTQGIIKYVGPKVKDTLIGDYIVFSEYAGTLVFMEGEGRLILLPEDLITCYLDSEQIGATSIDGLYFLDTNGEYFEATYEEIFSAISQTMTKKRKLFKVKEKKHPADKFREEAIKVSQEEGR